MQQNNKSKGVWKYFHQAENLLAFLVIFFLALVPTLEVIARKFYHTGVPNSTDYTRHLVLLIAFLGGMITSRQGHHLSLSLNLKIPEPLKSHIAVGTAFLGASLTTALTWSSLSFVLNSFTPRDNIGPFPIKLVAMVMVIGYGVMAARFITVIPGRVKGRRLAAAGFILGTLLALESIVNICNTLAGDLPGLFDSVVQFSHSINYWIAVPLIIILIISAVFGTPIFIILGGIAYLLFARAGEPLEVIPNEAYSMLTSHSIPAIPLFTFTGFLLSESKAGERLVRFFKALFSWFPGGLAIMAILACAFFTTFTGASGVTILALGALLSYILVQGKYSKRFSTGLLTASGSIGLLFPPSLPIIIYGVTAGISIKDMFLGGIVPGGVMVLALVIVGTVYAIKTGALRESFHLKEAVRALRETIWEVLLPVVILLCFFGGLTTLEESSAIAVIYTLIVEVFIHRDIKIFDLPKVMLKCIPIIGGVLTILALAKGLSYYIVDAQVPMQLTEWVRTSITSKYVFLFLLNIALLITGCFMDIFSAIMVVVPLIIPLGQIFGIHPVHLGIIFLANMELGYLTPPVGLNLFLAAYRFEEPMIRIYRYVLPFFLIQLAAVLLITYIPFLTTALF